MSRKIDFVRFGCKSSGVSALHTRCARTVFTYVLCRAHTRDDKVQLQEVLSGSLRLPPRCPRSAVLALAPKIVDPPAPCARGKRSPALAARRLMPNLHFHAQTQSDTLYITKETYLSLLEERFNAVIREIRRRLGETDVILVFLFSYKSLIKNVASINYRKSYRIPNQATV